RMSFTYACRSVLGLAASSPCSSVRARQPKPLRRRCPGSPHPPPWPHIHHQPCSNNPKRLVPRLSPTQALPQPTHSAGESSLLHGRGSPAVSSAADRRLSRSVVTRIA